MTITMIMPGSTRIEPKNTILPPPTNRRIASNYENRTTATRTERHPSYSARQKGGAPAVTSTMIVPGSTRIVPLPHAPNDGKNDLGCCCFDVTASSCVLLLTYERMRWFERDPSGVRYN